MPSSSWVRIGGRVAFSLTLLTLGWGLLSRPSGMSIASPAPAPSGSSPSRGGPVTFVGDSLTAQGDWQAAFPDRVVHNQGVSGYTSFQLMVRLPEIRRTGARTYLVMVGINDIVWGYDPGRIAGRIQWLRTGLQIGTGARVIVQSTIPCARFRCGPEGLRRVAELNQRLAEGDSLSGLRRSHPGDGRRRWSQARLHGGRRASQRRRLRPLAGTPAGTGSAVM